MTVSGLKFYRGTSDITANVSIKNKLNNNLKVGGSNLVSGSAVSDVVYITWDVTATDEEIIPKGSSQTYYLKGSVSGASAGESISFYIADDTTSLGTAFAAAADFGVAHANDTAAWSTTQAYTGGAYSAKLAKTTDATGSTYVQFTPNTGITLADLDDIDADPEWSFWRFLSATTTNWMQMELRFTASTNTDPEGAGHVDVTLMPLQNTLGTAAWVKTSIVATDKPAWCYYGNDPTDGTAFDACSNFGVADLTGIETDINAESAMTAGGDSASDWVLTRVRMELWEAIARTCYVDDVTIAGVTYAMEPMNFIWSDNSAISHSTSTADWINGYLVNDLATDTHTLSY